jgi:hypothetical protein
MNPISYKLYAKKGQQLILHLTSAKKNAVFAVYLPKMTGFLENKQNVKDWSGTLPQTGDYEIMVFPEDEVTDTTFTLEITIK